MLSRSVASSSLPPSFNQSHACPRQLVIDTRPSMDAMGTLDLERASRTRARTGRDSRPGIKRRCSHAAEQAINNPSVHQTWLTTFCLLAPLVWWSHRHPYPRLSHPSGDVRALLWVLVPVWLPCSSLALAAQLCLARLAPGVHRPDRVRHLPRMVRLLRSGLEVHPGRVRQRDRHARRSDKDVQDQRSARSPPYELSPIRFSQLKLMFSTHP